MDVVLLLHRLVAYSIVVLLLLIMFSGVGLRIARREESPSGLLAMQHWTENLLIVQIVLGIVLLVAGRRVIGELAFLHYLYGSLFPFIAVVGGRIAALRRERHDYVGLAWGAFFATGLASRAMLTGLESTGRTFLDLF